jgi:phage baseplate assembly protein W
MVEHHVSEALRRWERRIEVMKVNSEPGNDGSFKVVVEYRVLATNAVQSLNYTISNR